ncbi:MAG TPA: ScpA family protein [Azospirillaceae bacterium]|nr:ScpA family protein [Azospirillaceae bacterium]
MTIPESFEEDRRDAMPADESDAAQLVLDIDGFEGPIDMLLALAREQKVDLTHISILQLADQFLTFVAEARRVRLELAADYLVMAAWLAYLKSRLLLPDPDPEEPSGEDLAAALTFQLQRLEAMQEAGTRLMARPQLGREVFARGNPEGVDLIRKSSFDLTLYDLLKAYGDFKRRQQASTFHIAPTDLYSIEDAVKRLSDMLGRMPDWVTLSSFLPRNWSDGTITGRSALAAHFLATLELAKSGQLEVRQEGAFGPIYLRRASPAS